MKTKFMTGAQLKNKAWTLYGEFSKGEIQMCEVFFNFQIWKRKAERF